MLTMAGLETVWADDQVQQYRGNPGERMQLEFNPKEAIEIDRLISDFEHMQNLLLPWASKVSASDIPEGFLNLLLHEAYHAGQLGILRRSLGREGAV